MSSADDDLRALGRYIAVFSRLTAVMRFQLARMSTAKLPREDRLGEIYEALMLHTGDMNFDHLANVYSAVADLVGDYDETEQKMAGILRSQLDRFIEIRNDFAHGEWKIGWVGGPVVTFGPDGMTGGVPLPASLTRTKARRKGSKTSSADYSAQEINALSDKLARLGCEVYDWGRLVEGFAFVFPEDGSMSPEHEVRVARPNEVYALRGKTLTRTGPLAHLVGLPVIVI